MLHIFLLYCVLPLNARPATMWEYIRPVDQSTVVDGHLLEESLTGVAWMVLGSMLGEPQVDGSLAPFMVFGPRLIDLPFLGEVSIPPSPRGQEEVVDSRGSSSPPGGTSPSLSRGELSFSWATEMCPHQSSSRVGHLSERGAQP